MCRHNGDKRERRRFWEDDQHRTPPRGGQLTARDGLHPRAIPQSVHIIISIIHIGDVNITLKTPMPLHRFVISPAVLALWTEERVSTQLHIASH